MSVVRRGYVGRHVRRRLTKRRVVASSIGTLALFLGGLPLAGGAQAACALTPKLNDVSINQGLGSNTALARGKDTLVKLYLSLPDCATTSTTGGDQITIASTSTITVTGTNSSGTVVPQFTVPMYNAGGYAVGPASGAPYINQPADPVFLIPGNMLQPTNSAVFTLTVSANIAFTATPGAGSLSTRGTSPAAFTTRPGGSTPITATFEKKTNALRVLVVKMIDPQNANTFDSPTTPNAHNAVDAGMAQLSRLLPIPNGIKNLDCAPTATLDCGGLRYSFATGSINLRAVPSTANGVTTYYNLITTQNPTTKVMEYCETGSSLIMAQLESMRQSWNNANPLTPADRAVGVVDEANSLGTTTSSNLSCADGMGSLPGTGVSGTTAWVRACYKTCLSPASTGPSITGSLLGMELSHTIGLVPAARDDNSLHSPNVHADSLPTQPANRTFYLPGRSPVSTPGTSSTAGSIGDSHAVMDYASDAVSSWNDNDTLFEQLDWSYWQCALGGALSSECGAQANSVGTQLGVPAGGMYTISGSFSVDASTHLPTPTGTNIRGSFRAPNQALQTVPAPGSAYRLQQLSSTGAPCRDDGVGVTSADEHVAVGGPTVDAQVQLVDAAVPFAAGCASRVELRYISGGQNILLYSRDGGNAAPQVTARTQVALPGPGPISTYLPTTDNDSPEPNVTADAQWVALATGAEGSVQIGVAPVNPTLQGTPSITRLITTTGSTDPSWRYAPGSNQRQLAYVASNSASGDGDIWTVTVDTSGPVPVFGIPVQLTSGRQMHDPVWSRDGSRIVAEETRNGNFGNIVTIPSSVLPGTFATPTVILTSDTVSSTSTLWFEGTWSHTAGDNRLAVVQLRFSNVTAGQLSEKIFTVDPDAANPSSTLRLVVDNGDDPFWDDSGRIAYVNTQPGQLYGNLAIVRPDGSERRLLTANVATPTAGAIDDFASLAQGKLFFQRAPAPVQLPRPVGQQDPTPAIDMMTLASPTGPAVTVTANATAAQLPNLRVDVFAKCPQSGSVASPVATGISAFATTDTTATFSTAVDTTGFCAGASTLTAVVNDGFNQAAPAAAGTAAPPAPSAPQPAVVNPLPAQSYLSTATIPASGIVRDAQDGDLTASGRWTLRNAAGVSVATGSGASADFRPASPGWTPGDYTLTLAATDSAGTAGSRVIPITIVADADRDGLGDPVEQGSCFPAGHNSDPYDAWRDYDGDGIPNVDDPAPCGAASYYIAKEDFNPDHLNVGSDGNPVTVYITTAGSLADVPPGSVEIQKIQGEPVSGFTAVAWTVTGPHTATAQFDRPALESYLVSHNLVNRNVTFQVGGGSGSESFDGACGTYVAD